MLFFSCAPVNLLYIDSGNDPTACDPPPHSSPEVRTLDVYSIPSLLSGVIMGTFLSISEPVSPHLLSGDNNTLCGLWEVVGTWAKCPAHNRGLVKARPLFLPLI